jgi:hypothetical protein
MVAIPGFYDKAGQYARRFEVEDLARYSLGLVIPVGAAGRLLVPTAPSARDGCQRAHFVHADHDSVVRWSAIEPYDFVFFYFEIRIMTFTPGLSIAETEAPLSKAPAYR